MRFVLNCIDTESGRKVLQKQNKVHDYESKNQGTVGRDPQTRPPKKALGRQNSNTRSEAFGTIPEPGDVNVTHWREAYSDLHKSWSYQKSQIEELTNRYISQVKGTHQQVNVTGKGNSPTGVYHR